MKQNWNDYEQAGEQGPFALALKIGFGMLALVLIFGAISYGLSWFGGAAEVAQQEFGAKAAVTKYEWFKDAAAQLQKKQSDIIVYESRLASLKEAYGGTPRTQWSRVDQEAYNLASSEIAGSKAAYNMLAAEYNSASSKFNWRGFAGSVPQIIQPLVEK